MVGLQATEAAKVAEELATDLLKVTAADEARAARRDQWSPAAEECIDHVLHPVLPGGDPEPG